MLRLVVFDKEAHWRWANATNVHVEPKLATRSKLSASKRHPKALSASKKSSLYSLQARERPAMLWHPVTSCTIHLSKAHKNNHLQQGTIRLS